MEDLPEEIIDYILDFLPLQKRLNTRLLNKRFRDATFCIEIGNKIEKNSIFELWGFEILKFLFETSFGDWTFQIYDKRGKIRFYSKMCYCEGDGLARIIITDDLEEKFDTYDLSDGVSYKEGLRKLYCNSRDILKMTINSNSLLKCCGENYSIQKIIDVINKNVYTPGYEWFEGAEESVRKNMEILGNVKSMLSSTRKKEELERLLWMRFFGREN
jgi:hypothetical protein